MCIVFHFGKGSSTAFGSPYEVDESSEQYNDRYYYTNCDLCSGIQTTSTTIVGLPSRPEMIKAHVVLL